MRQEGAHAGISKLGVMESPRNSSAPSTSCQERGGEILGDGEEDGSR